MKDSNHPLMDVGWSLWISTDLMSVEISRYELIFMDINGCYCIDFMLLFNEYKFISTIIGGMKDVLVHLCILQ